MFAAIEDALARLYPTRRWGDRDDAVAMDEGIGHEEGERLGAAIASRLGTATIYRPGDGGEWCDYLYVLCLGRTPSIAEIRERLSAPAAPEAQRRYGDDAGDEVGIEERYLRVALSSVARFAGVQEVAMTLTREDDGEGDELVITERAQSGVFDPILLPRMQALVAVLATFEIRHVDFGEIVEAPEGFDPADYPAHFGAAPVIANYLFYPQPPTMVTTSVFPRASRELESELEPQRRIVISTSS
jgi:hypothetical protein